jgi:hypothetical protein
MKSRNAFIALLLPAAAIGQTMVNATGSGTGSSFSGTATFSVQRFMMPPITGAPYSGEETSQHVQTLADGTHITRSAPGRKIWRDSKGRTRTERPLFGNPMATSGPPTVTVVEIEDPVAGYRYVLDTQNKVAHRMAINTPGAAPGRSMTLSAEIPPPPPGARVSTATATTATGFAMVGGGGGGRAGTPMARPDMKNESLGTKMIEGVLVEGTRTVMTYAIGTQGNDQPISVTTENWFSPDLKLQMQSVTNDPRSGENTFKIQNFSRNEPDLSLFLPPPDYTIVDETGTFTIHYSGQ